MSNLLQKARKMAEKHTEERAVAELAKHITYSEETKSRLLYEIRREEDALKEKIALFQEDILKVNFTKGFSNNANETVLMYCKD